jgi:hypothetical protein
MRALALTTKQGEQARRSALAPMAKAAEASGFSVSPLTCTLTANWVHQEPNSIAQEIYDELDATDDGEVCARVSASHLSDSEYSGY